MLFPRLLEGEGEAGLGGRAQEENTRLSQTQNFPDVMVPKFLNVLPWYVSMPLVLQEIFLLNESTSSLPA